MSLIFHGCDLRPFVLANVISFDRAKSLFSREATKNEYLALANGDGVSVSRLGHLSLIQNLILLRHINSGILLWWRTSTGDENFSRR